MKKAQFLEIEEYMLECMGDSAHTSQHIYRVLFLALQIAQKEKNVDYDVLIASCLLHDIGRDKQFSDPAVCHAEAGAKMAGEFLDGKLEDPKVMHICECIRTHRFRGDSVPKSIEAKFSLMLILLMSLVQLALHVLFYIRAKLTHRFTVLMKIKM